MHIQAIGFSCKFKWLATLILLLICFNGFTQPQTPLVGDLNNDNVVDQLDQLLLIQNWHKTIIDPSWTSTPTPTPTQTQEITPTPTVSPTATEVDSKAFFAIPQGGPAPLEVEFQYADVLAIPSITSWEWDFSNDGIVDSTEVSPIHIYDASGIYSVALSIENASGQVFNYLLEDFVNVRRPVEPLVRNNVVVVDNDPNLSYVSSATGELVLQQTGELLDPIWVGTIVVGSDNHGYARRVLSITSATDTLFLQTEAVALEEIFKQADISGLVRITPEDLSKAGFQINADGRALRKFDGVEIHPAVHVSGELELDPYLEWDCNIGWTGVNSLRVVYGGDLTFSYSSGIDVQGSLHLPEDEYSVSVLDNPIEKWNWYQIGIVPVIIYTEFDIRANCFVRKALLIKGGREWSESIYPTDRGRNKGFSSSEVRFL